MVADDPSHLLVSSHGRFASIVISLADVLADFSELVLGCFTRLAQPIGGRTRRFPRVATVLSAGVLCSALPLPLTRVG